MGRSEPPVGRRDSFLEFVTYSLVREVKVPGKMKKPASTVDAAPAASKLYCKGISLASMTIRRYVAVILSSMLHALTCLIRCFESILTFYSPVSLLIFFSETFPMFCLPSRRKYLSLCKKYGKTSKSSVFEVWYLGCAIPGRVTDHIMPGTYSVLEPYRRDPSPMRESCSKITRRPLPRSALSRACSPGAFLLATFLGEAES